MEPNFAAMQELLRDPSANYTAVALAIAALVTFMLVIILTLIAVVMPKRRAVPSGNTDEPPRLGVAGVTLIVAIMALGVTGGAALWYQQTSSDEFCSQTCHSMEPATRSWARSPHASVDCIRCHEDSGLRSVPRNAAYRLYYVYREYVAKGPVVPLAVPAARCLACHQDIANTRLVARNGDPFTHRAVIDERTSCRSCHRSQGHEPARR